MIKTDKNDFILFLEKMIPYHYAIQNNVIVSIYDVITTYFVEIFFIINKWITIDKTKKDVKIGPI